MISLLERQRSSRRGSRGTAGGEQWQSHTHHALSDQELEPVSRRSALLVTLLFFPWVSVYVNKTTIYASGAKIHAVQGSTSVLPWFRAKPSHP